METLKQTDISSNNKETPAAPKKYSKIMKNILNGNKENDKLYHHHTGYPGGIKSITLGKLLQEKPEKAIEMAVKGMMPKNKLSRSMLGKLKVYAGNDHPHVAQQPQPLEI